MKSIGRCVLFILAALFALPVVILPGGLFAQGEALSLERTRELALRNSRSLARYNLAIQSSLLTEKTHKHRYLPQLSLDGQVSGAFLTQDGFTQDFAEGVTAEAGLGLSYTIDIWNGGTNSVLSAINSLNTEMSRQDALAEYYNVLDSADTAYYSALEAAAALAAAESSLETAGLSLTIAEVRREGGMISEAEYLKALSEKANAETARNQSRRDLAVTNLSFRELTGLESVPPLEPVDFSFAEELILSLSELDDAGVEPLYAALWKQIQTRNPTMVRAAINSEKSGKEASRAARAYSPTLSASVSSGLTYSNISGLAPSGRVSLSAKIPLDFWVTAANVEGSKIASSQAALDYRGTVNSLDMEVRTSLLDLISRAGQILSSRRALEYAQKHFDYTLELYRLSGVSPSELSDAETLVRNSRNQLSSAQYSFLSALSKIRSIGVFRSEKEVLALFGFAN